MTTNTTTVLSPLEAAHRLGVTPALIFAYMQHAPKQALGDDRRLAFIDQGGQLRIASEELEAFDRFLHEPWARSPRPRPAIPDYVRVNLKIEAGGRCARCGDGQALEDAHIDDFAVSLSHHHHNLLRLCKKCHSGYDSGLLDRSEMRALKDGLIAKMRASLAAPAMPEASTFGPPDGAAKLHGRAQDVAAIVQLLDIHGAVLVTGVGGVGKTQALLAALKARRNTRPVLWLGVEQHRSTDEIRSALDAMVLALGGTTGETISTLLNRTRACLVLDGVEQLSDLDGVGDLIGALVAVNLGGQVIVTSQSTLPGVPFDAEHGLKGLDGAAARAVLGDFARGRLEADGPAVQRLLDLADGHPLTLKIMGALAAHFEDAGLVVERIETNGAATLAVPGRSKPHRSTSLGACLAVALAALSADERKLLWIAAQCPAPFYNMMLRDAPVGVDDLDAAIAGLQGWSLIDILRSGDLVRISTVSPVRLFARAEIPLELELVNGFALAVAVYVAGANVNVLRNGDPEGGMSLIGGALPNALSAIQLCQDHLEQSPTLSRPIVSLAGSLMMFFFSSGRFEEGKAVMRAASLSAARAGDLKRAVQMLTQFYTLAERSGDADGRAWALAEAERLAKGLDGEALGHVRMMQAAVAERAGDYGRAAALAKEAEGRFASTPGGEHYAAMAMLQQGRALESGGDPAAALEALQRALVLVVGDQDPINTGSIQHHIGNCQAELGKAQEAANAYVAAAEAFHRLEADEFRSNALGELGLLLIEAPEVRATVAALSPDVVRGGFEDVIGGLAERVANPRRGHDNIRVRLRKFVGLIVVAEAGDQLDDIENVGEHLAEAICMPMLEQCAAQGRQVPFELMMASCLADFCVSLGPAADGEGAAAPTPKELAQMCVWASRVGMGAGCEDRLISWLPDYFERRRGLKISADDIADLLARADGRARRG
ncbi:hypothetical protein PMI01_00634 [Caulobacter sp. AP07]|uniref:HNH endonuclease n=1 Tax=Caulobacter sp. AP07 TaxID=1144304 RepID=UPI000271ED56|nr:HNH endonuclease [Caulobacter sp. AP07]EJL37556.1 hypothetical protein PMI01_00634 [Caulobacter sp. AP07]